MTPHEIRRIDEICQAARQLPPAERPGFLDDVCRENEVSRERIERMLEPDDTGTGIGPLQGDQVSLDGNQPTLLLVPENWQPRQTLALGKWGPFRLDAKVGQGSFGEVYRAFDTVLQREVALKLLRPGRIVDSEQADALREARSLAKVRHPNVVSVYGLATHNGRTGFWSDFVHGKTLNELLTANGPFGARETALIGIDLCRALGAVHSAGLLHRDIKSANVMRESGGRILLMDFGLTHAADTSRGLAGTLPYMAPELLEDAPGSVSSDIYAMGVLLFNLLTAGFPFTGATLEELRAGHQSRGRRRLLDERSDLPEPLAKVIETATDVLPENRYASAGEMIAAISEAIGSGSATRKLNNSRWSAMRRWQIWAVAGATALALLAAASFTAPGRNLLSAGKPAGTVAVAHADYLKAQDLLDHYYKPQAIDDAVVLFQKAVAADPGFATGYAGLARAYLWQYRDSRKANSVELSQAASNRALELDRENASAHVTLGMLAADTGRSDLAAEELKQAVRLNARGADAYSALAELYQKEGRTVEVEPAIQKAIDLAPGAWRYLNQLGLYYLSVGKYEAAAAQFLQATRLNPDNARAFNNLGLAYRRQNRLAEARIAYEKSLQLAPSFNTLSNLGTILQAEGKNAEAAEVYRRAVAMNPSSYASWGNMASAWNRTPGGKSRAAETYRQAISLAEATRVSEPNNASVITDLAVYYAALGDAGKSVPMLRQASALEPENPQILYRVGEGYELLHRREQALLWLGKALQFGLSTDTIARNPELNSLRADPRFLLNPR